MASLSVDTAPPSRRSSPRHALQTGCGSSPGAGFVSKQFLGSQLRFKVEIKGYVQHDFGDFSTF